MRVIIINNHCDSRNITIPGTGQIVRLPASVPVEITLTAAYQLQELYDKLAVKAPASEVIAESGIDLDISSDEPAPDSSASIDTDSGAGILEPESAEVEPPQVTKGRGRYARTSPKYQVSKRSKDKK